jgi:hypothetical protein
MSLLFLEDLYQNKATYSTPFCDIIKKEISCSATPLSTCFPVSFLLSVFPFPLEMLGAWSRLGLEILGDLALPT